MVCVRGARVLPERRAASVLSPRPLLLQDHGASCARETPFNTRYSRIGGKHLYPVAQCERQAVSSLNSTLPRALIKEGGVTNGKDQILEKDRGPIGSAWRQGDLSATDRDLGCYLLLNQCEIEDNHKLR